MNNAGDNVEKAIVLRETVLRYGKVYIRPVIAHVAILYALLLGFLFMAEAMGERLNGIASYIGRFIKVPVWQDPSMVAVLLGIFMLFLSYQLWLRKRAALVTLAAFLLLQAAVDISRGRLVIDGLIGIVLAAVFLTTASEFPAKPDPASFKRLKIAVPLFFGLFIYFGVGGVYLLRDRLGAQPNVFAMIYRSVTIAVGENGGVRFQGWAAFYRFGLTLFFIMGFLYLLILLFRSCREQIAQRNEDCLKARELVERYGSDSLSYFNLRCDKSLFFYSDEIFLAYRTVRGTAVISGDPVGPADLVPKIIEAFREYCLERGWRMTAVGSSEENMELYREAGLKGICIGEEAIIALGNFSLEGRNVRKLRQSTNKLEKMGVTTEFMYNASIPPHMKHELQQISVDWRGSKPETGFSMGLGRLMNSDDPDCLLTVAYDADRKPIGFIYLVPMYPHLGYSLDVTRYMPGSPTALSEFMLARTAVFLKEHGYRFMSLHFLALSQHYRKGHEVDGNPVIKLLARALDIILPVVSQYTFDKKFLPRWKKRYLVFQSLIDVPLGAASVVSVESALKLTRNNDRN